MIGIWSSWCQCHPIISCSSKIQKPFGCRLTQVVLKKRPLNGCGTVTAAADYSDYKIIHFQFFFNGFLAILQVWPSLTKRNLWGHNFSRFSYAGCLISLSYCLNNSFKELKGTCLNNVDTKQEKKSSQSFPGFSRATIMLFQRLSQQ